MSTTMSTTMAYAPPSQAADLAPLSIHAQDFLETLRIALPILNPFIDKFKTAYHAGEAHALGCACYLLLSVLNCPVHLQSLEGWPEIKALAEKALESAKRTLAVQHPITDFWARKNDHPLAYYQTSPLNIPRRVDEQSATLYYHFYEAKFLGNAHTLIFQFMERLEALIKIGWSEAQPSYSDCIEWYNNREPYYARCLPIIQSPGMGKSRLLRELGKLTSEDGQERVFVLTLCCRPNFEGTDACVPETDTITRNFFNKPDYKAPYGRWERWAIRTHIFLQVLWEGICVIHEQEDGEQAFRDLCDPNTTYKRQLRSGFLSKVTRLADHMAQGFLDRIDESAPEEVYRRHRYDQELTESASRALFAAQSLREKLREGDWFVLALDEASGIYPRHLFMEHDYDRPIWVTKDCLTIFARLFSNAQPSLWRETSMELARPERFWLAIADTNPALSELDLWQSGARVPWHPRQAMFSQTVPAVFPVNLNLHLEETSFASQLLRATPLEASTEFVLAHVGRPLWQALFPVESKSCMARSGHWPRPESGKQTFATPAYVLEQLLGPLGGAAALDVLPERSEVLIFQRLAIKPARIAHDLEEYHSAISHLFSRVQRHLGVIIARAPDGKGTEVVVPPEPLVTKAATAFFRTNGKDVSGNAYLFCAGINVWREVWTSFWESVRQDGRWELFSLDESSLDESNAQEDFVDQTTPSPELSVDVDATLFSLDEPNVQEDLVAQATLCMAHDRAVRRPQYELKGVPEMMYLGPAAFVHVYDFMEKYSSAGLPKGMVCDFIRGGWMSFERFVRAHKHGFDRGDLVLAFFMRTAIAALPDQYGYNLVIPIYCAPLEETFHPKFLTWAELQLKRRETRPTRGIRAQRIDYGDFLADDEQGKVTPYSDFEPLVPPVVIQLDMAASNGREDFKQVHIASNAPQERKCWYVEFPAFDQRKHPVLQEIWPDGNFRPVPPPVAEESAPLVNHDLQAQVRNALTGEAVLRRSRD